YIFPGSSGWLCIEDEEREVDQSNSKSTRIFLTLLEGDGRATNDAADEGARRRLGLPLCAHCPSERSRRKQLHLIEISELFAEAFARGIGPGNDPDRIRGRNQSEN